MIGEVKILSNAEVTEQSILILVSTSILFCYVSVLPVGWHR